MSRSVETVSMHSVRVAIVGDFDSGKHSHWATEAALFHAAARLGLALTPHWIATPELAQPAQCERLADFDGIWGAPGSPYAAMQGSLNAIHYARTRDVPYLGTCAGFQYALIEFSRNVLGIADADSAENDANGKNIVITPVACAMPKRAGGGPALCGTGVARPVKDTLLENLCGQSDLSGQYFCSFETNPVFVPQWQAAGLKIAARGADHEMRAFELSQNRFLLATLFQPQLSSSYDDPHPLILGYLRACSGKS